MRTIPSMESRRAGSSASSTEVVVSSRSQSAGKWLSRSLKTSPRRSPRSETSSSAEYASVPCTCSGMIG
ncbi:hypothetical protein DF19_19880 [Streptomyces olindensis]|nr:hypothetical protein DF19_19880 [Streptomyces olindensis]